MDKNQPPAFPQWRKSSSCGPSAACVEVADLGSRVVGVRDSKNPAGPVLAWSRDEWNAFLRQVKDGTMDL